MRRCRDERGYAVILGALLLVPLMGFAGFAVDVGSWYSRASALQRAADAASLAGVVWQPNTATADQAAREEAARNGFVDGVDGITVNVIPLASNQLRVEITDADADMFFAGLFLDNVSIGRGATAEYVDSVPLGSPKNHFGTNDLLPSGDENFSAAINGSCTPREQGDHRSTHFMNNWSTAGATDDVICPSGGGGPGPDVGVTSGNTGWNANPFHESGYSFAYYIDIPTALTSSVDVLLRDPNYDSAGPLDGGDSTAYPITTNFVLKGPDGSPLNDLDNVPFTSCSSGSAGSTGTFSYPSATTTGSLSVFAGDGGTWDRFCRIPAGAQGRYILEVGTADFELGSVGSNSYAVLALPVGAGSATCDTRVSATCPSVVARDWMSIYAALGGTAADFFLAEIGDEHEGKSMQITLFDPGEGSDFLQILDPDGTPVSFTWQTRDGIYSGSGTSLTVSGTCGVNCPAGNASTSQFSDRFVEITVPLPPDFSTAYTTGSRWWKVFYNTGAAPTDRTSWSVEILGDPVRLLD